MSKHHLYSFALTLSVSLTSFFLLGCEDIINLKTQKGPELLVVDGWINNQHQTQKIQLSYSGGYFEDTAPKPGLDAIVHVTDELGRSFEFKDTNRSGIYTWVPVNGEMLGKVGGTYTLNIKIAGEEYTATNEIKRVPRIDSLIYREESLPIKPEKGPKDGYVAEFYARDPIGEGDCYWIKALKDGKPNKSQPRYISVAYDAGFNPGAPADGLIFIRPIRTSITIEELFSARDSIGVELHSITYDTFKFLQLVRQESTNGGLLAVPSVNIPSNIKNVNTKGRPALGFFGASAVSRVETSIDPAKARPKED